MSAQSMTVHLSEKQDLQWQKLSSGIGLWYADGQTQGANYNNQSTVLRAKKCQQLMIQTSDKISLFSEALWHEWAQHCAHSSV